MKTKYDNVIINPEHREIGAEHQTPIAFDLDSVLNTGLNLDIMVALCREFNVPMGSLRTVDPEYGFEMFSYKVSGVSDRDIARVVNQSVYEDSPSALPSAFMSEVMSYVHQVTGRPIAVVTARHTRTVGVTYRWLAQWLDTIPFYAYIINGDTKNSVLNYIGTEIFVDDRHNTIKGLVNQIPWPVLYKHPWNQGRPERLPVVEIRDLRDVIPLLNIITGRVPMMWPCNVPYPKPDGERITKRYATVR